MSVSPLRLSITGGRGRLASLIADHFRAPHYEVTLFSRTPGPNFTPLDALLEPTVLARSDVILHLAWSSLPATSEKNPGIEDRYDLPWLERLLAAQADCPADRRPHLVFFSTGGAVYGNAPERPNHEDDPCQPIGRYGRAKLAAEQLIQARSERHDLASTILRISNPYGYPVPMARAQGLIPHALRFATEGQPLPLWGDGSARKDFLYYTDFLAALDPIIHQRPRGVFNLAAGESHSVREIIALVEKHTERTMTTQLAAAPAWDVQDSRLDRRRLSAATGWEPQVSLDEGIRRSATGFMNH